MKGNVRQVPVGLPIGQNEPIGVQEQLASSHCLSHTPERTNRWPDQDTERGAENDFRVGSSTG
jgi:hypothetical protein